MLRSTTRFNMIPKLTHYENGVTKIILDNPKSLNAVDHETVVHMRNLLFSHLNKTEEAGKKTTKAFVIRGAGPKSFCSGGDVVSVATQKPAGVRHKFFYTEYQVNHAIGETSVPYVSLWNGIVMGGGFGVSIHGSHRVATPQTLFAMPETAIGLFPDVGGSWVLPRLPFEGLGLFLALSGSRLKGADIFHAGLATSYAENVEKLDQLDAKLCSATEEESVDSIISEFSITEKSKLAAPFSLQDDLAKIEEYFGSHHKSLHSLVDGLKKAQNKWAQNLYTNLQKMSPTSVAVSYEAHRRGAECKTRAEMFEMEYRLSQSMSNHNDFYAGVDALLMSKHKNPKWDPATLDEVLGDYKNKVEKLFEKREEQQPTWSTRALEEDAFEYLNKK